jgi:hypothetical protein
MKFLPVFCFVLALSFPATAQLDSGKLRAKFGAPLHRETFRMPAGFDLVVDYGGSGSVCKVQTPAMMPSTERVSNTDVMRQRMLDFLSELIPPAMRGTELRKNMAQMGINSILMIEYEQVVLTASQYTVSVTFKNSECQAQ